MQDRNGYFQIIDDSSKTAIKVFPPSGGGERLKVDEVIAYLDKVGVKEYDLIKLNEAVNSEREVTEVISKEGCYPIDEKLNVVVTPDKMYAIAKFYKNSTKGKRMSKEDIIFEIEKQKIIFGIDEDVIEEFIKEPVYCRNVVIAKGTKPIDGKDASIQYNFQTDRKAKPQLKEDGTVDFHNLNNISNIKAGDVLAVLTKADLGTDGTDVYGNVVKPRKVNKLTLKHGNNLEISEDGLRLISKVDGHATLEGDKVFVSDNFDVPADVDNSTGDIKYNGSVTVKGNVRTGFSIIADGNVEVFGVVEGAKIDATGDIIIHRGIQGMGKSDIRAKGNIISKFIESADVVVDGYVETDTILNSNVSAKGDVYVRGRSASLIGGNVRSSTLIEAANIGSPMGTVTNVEVGTDPTIKDNIKKLKNLIEDKKAENVKIEQVLTVMRKKKDMGTLEEDKIPMLQQLTKNVILNNTEIKKAEAELAESEKELAEDVNARIRAIKAIHAGTRITIAGDYITVHNDVIHSEFRRVKGEIKANPF